MKQKARSLYNKSVITSPKGFALTSKLQKDWASYESISKVVRESILDPLRANIDDLIREATEGKIASAERRNIALQDVEKERDSTVRELVGLRRETAEAASFMQAAVKDVLQEEFSHLRVNIEQVIDKFVKDSAENPDKIDQARYEVERRITELRSRETEFLDSFKRQMVELAEGIRSRETLDDRFAALEARNQVLEEQIEFYSDFAQMGMSVGILQHEFERAARGISPDFS